MGWAHRWTVYKIDCLRGQHICLVIRGVVAIVHRGAVLIECETVVQRSLAGDSEPLVPARRDIFPPNISGEAIQILADQRGAVARIVEPRGDRRLFTPQAVERPEPAIRNGIGEQAVVVGVLSA